MRAVVLGLLLAAIPASALAGSVPVPSTLTGKVKISGTGCVTPATASVDLPRGASNVNVRKPQVGDVRPESHITGVEVDGDAVRISAQSTAELCFPEAEWSDTYRYAIDYEQRTVVHFSYGSYRTTPHPVRPRNIEMQFYATVRDIKWRSFGGRKAVGFGTIRFDEPPGVHCTPKTCLGEGDRFKVVLSRPSLCGTFGPYYGKYAFVTTTQVGVVKPGREMASKKPDCLGGADPI